jgi:DNA-binding ferritin-like protein (Dps family)
MTPTEFLDLSTRLCKDLKDWTEEMSRADKLPPEYLESLKEAYGVIERVTVGAADAASPAISVAPETPSTL